MTSCSCDSFTSGSSTTACTISNTSTGKALEVSSSSSSSDCSVFTCNTVGSAISISNSHASGSGVRATTASGKGLHGTATSSGNGVYGSSISGAGIIGASSSGAGINGVSSTGPGILATSTDGIAINGASTNGYGIYASSINASALLGITAGTASTNYGVYGQNNCTTNGGPGVYGSSISGNGVVGSVAGAGAQVYGIYGKNTNTTASAGHIGAGICGEASGQYAYGVIGTCTANYGTGGKFYGGSTAGTYGIGVNSYGSLYGVYASSSSSGTGIYTSGAYIGIDSFTTTPAGMAGRFTATGTSSIGVYTDGNFRGIVAYGTSNEATAGYFSSQYDGVIAWGEHIGITANCETYGGIALSAVATNGALGLNVSGRSYLDGEVEVTNPSYFSSSVSISGVTNTYDDVYINSSNLVVTGTVSKLAGTFSIDHPVDPENKILQHSFVESPDMKNIYDGVITCDKTGNAIVELPSYFSALNKDFRYVLTCIGQFSPVYVSKKIENNCFEIAGGVEGMEISWQVTGIRQDPYALDNPIIVEKDKTENQKGKYLSPNSYGKDKSFAIKGK